MAWGPQALFITPAYSVASGAKGELSWQGPSVTRCLTCLLFSLSPNLPLATQWDAFSIPELQNFLTILEKEEQDKDGSGAMTRSPSPLAWRPDFPGAPREAH